MDVREKLVEVLKKCGVFNTYAVVQLANALADNGVTVQEWISVKDERKPNHGDIALCYMTFEEYRLLQWDDRSKLWVGDYMDYGFEDVAYWQMPQPPKGE